MIPETSLLQRIMQSLPFRPCVVCSRPTNQSCGQCRSAWYCSPGHFQSVRNTYASCICPENTATPLRIGHAIVNNAFPEVTTAAPLVAQLSLLQQEANLKYLRFYFLIKKVFLFIGGPDFFLRKICIPRPSTHNHCQLPVLVGVSDSTHPESFSRSLPINVDYSRLERGKIEYASSVVVFSIGVAEPFTC